MLRLVEIDRHNYLSVLDLSVSTEQRDLVATNQYSLAQAYAQPECVPLALYAENKPVGFAMYSLDEDDHQFWIYRLMIDQRYQGVGYGREAMRLLIERIRGLSDDEHRRIYISFEPENEIAKSLYESLGFMPDGRMLYGEVVYFLEL
ncbi:MAG: GNAT family N-acetyltransferase [Eubacteriales bacterium]|jgi:diamine N-acetyltransferase|nr:GNAT family N-acetyltransferase [Eubacteriales bacterium]